MKRVSALILLTALGVNSFGVDGKAIRQRPIQNLIPQSRPAPATSLQQARWDRDYRDNSPVGGSTYYPDRVYQNGNSFPLQPSIYNEAPRSTEQGWWNEEKRDFSTVENRRDRRKYSNSKYGSNIVPITNTNKYDVTPDEWRADARYETVGSPYQQGERYFDDYNRNGGMDSRPRQTLRANDRDGRAYQYDNNYDPNAVTPEEWRAPQQPRLANQNFGNGDAGYNYGFNNGVGGEVVGTYGNGLGDSFNLNNNYDPNDVTPQEWRDQKSLQGNGYNNPQFSNIGQQGMYNGPQYDGYQQDNGLYDPTSGQGSWWNEEKRDFSTNLGRRETRSYGGARPMSYDKNSVTPDEWRNNGQYNKRGGGFNSYNGRNNRPVSYIDRVQGPPPPVRNWWDNVKNGFRNVSVNSNSRNGRRGNYNNANYNNANYNNANYNNVNYNNANNGRYYNNANYDRYDNYYDDYQRQEYVTQPDDWWKTETRNYNTW